MTVTLLASAARTSSGTSSTTGSPLLSRARAAVLALSVTADEQTASDTLDVVVQHSVDGGTTWDDFARFSQQLGDAGASGVVEELHWTSTLNDDEARAPTDMGMAAGTVKNGPIGPDWRVKWAINDASGFASFTFSVAARVQVR